MNMKSGRSARVAVVIGLALMGTPVAAYAAEPATTGSSSSQVVVAQTASTQEGATQSSASGAQEAQGGSAAKDSTGRAQSQTAAATSNTTISGTTTSGTSQGKDAASSDDAAQDTRSDAPKASDSTTQVGSASSQASATSSAEAQDQSDAARQSTTASDGASADSAPSAAASAKASTSQTDESPSVSVDVNVDGKGKQTVTDGQIAGTTGEDRKIDSFTLHIVDPEGTSYSDKDIEYRAHVEDYGWDQAWTMGGKTVGTAGKRMEALQFRLRNGSALAAGWQLWVRAHVQNYGWLAWTSDGLVGSTGQGLRLEALEFRLLKIGATQPSDPSYADFDSAGSQSFIDGTQAQVQAHVQDIGWQGWVTDGKTAGTTGQGKRIEAIRVKVANAYATGDVQVRAHVQDIGWQGWADSSSYAGTTGQSKRVEAVQVRLTGDLANIYDVWYRAHVQTMGWMAWTKDGASAGTTGASGRMEAIQVLLVRKGGSAPSATDQGTTLSFFSAPDIVYTAHSKDIGWQGAVKDGDVSGTTGRSLRLEAMTIKLEGGQDACPGGITYRAHVQDIGWQGWVSDGAVAGTTGQSKRIEAFQAKLTGEIAKFFDVVYQAHVQNIGWMNWVMNGATAGTTGRSLEAEAYRVKLVLKDTSAAPATGLNYCWLKDSPYWNGTVKVKLMNKHYTAGRYDANHGGQHTIKQIVIHHNDGNLTTETCWETWQTREASAHYQVEANGTVGQLVYDSDTAWHAGNWVENLDSIGIEHADAPGSGYGHWSLTEATINAGSKLVALLCLKYNLGRPVWGVNVVGHNEVSSTDCPGSLGKGGSQHDEYIGKAQSWYDKILAAMLGK